MSESFVKLCLDFENFAKNELCHLFFQGFYLQFYLATFWNIFDGCLVI